ncbi:MAG: ATP-binding protein [Gammaproteobacteria bacterium]
MKLLPSRLVPRLALLIALLIIFTQVAWFAIVQIFWFPHALTNRADFLTKEIRLAALSLTRPHTNERARYLQISGSGRFFRIIPAPTHGEHHRLMTHRRLGALRRTLDRSLGQKIVFARGSHHHLWIGFKAGSNRYWLILNSSHPRSLLNLYRLLWIILGILASVGGAYLILFRSNRRLEDVLHAARDVGHGRKPRMLEERGPQEIVDLSHGFNQMVLNLEKIADDRRIMLAGISHDLRTPLTRIRLGLELLAKHAEPHLTEGLIQDLEEINSILNQFLDYARDESTEPPKMLNWNTLIQEVAQRYQESGHLIRLRLEALPPYPGRRLALRRMLVNLFDNAVRYGQRDIEVHTRLEAPRTFRIQILDRGPGLPAVDRHNWLEPFVRGSSDRSAGSGAGLGLTIVGRIVALHGGHLSIENRQGGGLLVDLTFSTSMPDSPSDSARTPSTHTRGHLP